MSDEKTDCKFSSCLMNHEGYFQYPWPEDCEVEKKEDFVEVPSPVSDEIEHQLDCGAMNRWKKEG